MSTSTIFIGPKIKRKQSRHKVWAIDVIVRYFVKGGRGIQIEKVTPADGYFQKSAKAWKISISK